MILKKFCTRCKHFYAEKSLKIGFLTLNAISAVRENDIMHFTQNTKTQKIL